MVTIRRTAEADWSELKRVRLAAPREASYAFGSTYARERRFDECRWRDWAQGRRRAVGGVTFLAFEAGRPVGMVGAFRAEDDGAMLVAMWVAPEARHKGVGRALVARVVDWAAEVGLRRVTLWVAEDNVAAWRLYEDLGFKQSEEREPMPSDPSRQITRFDLDLPSGA